MKYNHSLLSLAIALCCTTPSDAQNWSGIIGTGRAIDWSAAGIPGGIPTTRTICTTVNAATYGNGAADAAAGIQAALNACGASKVVLLGAGTFRINSSLNIPSNVTLRGSGPQNTILSAYGTSGSIINMGTWGDLPYVKGSATITSGATAGSTKVVLSSTSLDSRQTTVSAGGYMMVTELNDPTYVTGSTLQNASCTYCDNSMFGGTRLRGQIVEITSVSGAGPYTVTFNPPLYTNYGVAAGTATALATPFGVENGGLPDAQWAGIESLQIYANGTGVASGMTSISLTECAYCWVENIESNYSDADHVDVEFGFRDEIRDSYFTNAYGHAAGTSDSDLMLAGKTCCTLVENNIFERLHSSVVINWGAAGNVIAYNYSMGSFDAVGYNSNQIDFSFHGAHPQFNLFEGNSGPNFYPDSFHGSSAYNTAFRNWFRAATQIAHYPAQTVTSGNCSGGTCTIAWASGTSNFYGQQYIVLSGTSVANCNQEFLLAGSASSHSSYFSSGVCNSWTGGQAFTYNLGGPPPIAHQPVDWVHSHEAVQQNNAFTIAFPATFQNLVGNVAGSTEALNAVGQTNLYKVISGLCISCALPPASRPYGGEFFAYTFGYDTAADSNGSGVATFPGGPSNTPGYWVGRAFTTTFLQGNYDIASGLSIWDVNFAGNHTLPASFYRTSKPSWFGSVPWPAIGPDVSGGIDAAGHVYAIPAQACYNNTPKDANGLLVFDASTCYAIQTQTPPTILPPSSVTATVK